MFEVLDVDDFMYVPLSLLLVLLIVCIQNRN